MNANEGVRQFLAKRNDKENITITGHKMNKLNVSQTHDSKRTLDLDQSIPLIQNQKEKCSIFTTQILYTHSIENTLCPTLKQNHQKNS